MKTTPTQLVAGSAAPEAQQGNLSGGRDMGDSAGKKNAIALQSAASNARTALQAWGLPARERGGQLGQGATAYLLALFALAAATQACTGADYARERKAQDVDIGEPSPVPYRAAMPEGELPERCRYEYGEGFQEWVVSCNGGSGNKAVTFDDGTEISHAQFRLQDRARLTERCGALLPLLCNALDAEDRLDEVIIVSMAVHYDATHDGGEDARLQEAHDAAIAHFESFDFEFLYLDESAPPSVGLTAQALGSDIWSARYTDLVGLGERPDPNTPGGTRWAAPFHVAHHNLEGYNDDGYYGSGVRVGVLDGVECGIYEDHDAFFALANVDYAFPPPSCTTNADCEIACNPTGVGAGLANHVCVSGECVGVHATQVSSVISASDSSPWGAAKVELFVGNAHDGTGSGRLLCNPDAVRANYSWFADKDVNIVNESWGCFYDHGDTDGQWQDYFSRTEGIAIVKSAGNSPGYEACHYSPNSICVGSATSADAWHPFSSFLNPNSLTGGDREEPDLLALDDPAVASLAGPSSFTSSGGTSFAAPAVTSYMAILSEVCDTTNFTPRSWRAWLKHAQFNVNPDGFAYSSPGSGNGDEYDGGGRLFAIDHPCSDPSGGGGASTDWLDVDNNPQTDGTAGFTPPPPEGYGTPPGTHHLAPDPVMDTRVRTFGGDTKFTFSEGDRIRATISWDSCTDGMTPSEVAVDYDLHLYHHESNSYFFGSESRDDNVEGFDVVVDEDGTYELVVIWDNGDTPCAGSNEPFSLYWTTWN